MNNHSNNCSNLFFLSTIACKLSQCLTEKELTLLSSELVTLGEMLETESTRRELCKDE